MIARKNLLSLKTEFSRIRKTGQMYSSESFGLLVSYGTNSLPQASFIVSKKISLKSVVRHEVKRRLADAVMKTLPRLKKNSEMVFLAKQKAVGKTTDDLLLELEPLLKRAKLI